MLFTQAVIDEIDKEADSRGINTAALLAIAEVESAGVAEWDVDGQKLPPIRFEGHIFHKYLSGDKLKQAVALGLASPVMGAVKNPSSYRGRYDLFERAAKIDRDVAIMATSWGLGQVMGSNWQALEYDSPQALMEAAKSGIPGQVDLMTRFIFTNHLDDELNARDWKGFARGYNGPKYAVNKYDVKMKEAYNRWYGHLKPDPKADIKRWQSDLIKLGYDLGRAGADGVPGRLTEIAVRKFQGDHGLVVDGKVGPMTLAEIAKALAAKSSKTATTLTKAGMTATALTSAGAAILTTTINDQITVLKPVLNLLPTPYGQYILGGLTAASVILTFYGVIKKLSADKEL